MAWLEAPALDGGIDGVRTMVIVCLFKFTPSPKLLSPLSHAAYSQICLFQRG
jgi:hypothetical protein